MPKMKLSDIGKLSRGKSKHRPRNDKILYEGKYPFIQTSDIKNANHILQTYEQTYNETGLKQSKLWSKNTICITIAANIADSAILGFDACFPDSVIGLTVNDNIANYHYVEYLLQYYKKIIQKQSNGTSQENINLETFEQVLFDIPSLKEQDNISYVLYTLDKKISLNNKINNELEQMAKTLYDYWFVQFDFPDEKGRPYKSANGKMVYNEVLKREIPAGWEVLKLENRFAFERGKEYGSQLYKDSKQTDNDIKFYRVGDMDGSASTYIDRTTVDFCPMITKDDVVVSFDGSVGRIGFALNGTYSTGMRKIYDYENIIKSSTIYFIFNDNRIQATISKYASGSNILHASASIEHLIIPYNEKVYLSFQQKIEPIFNKMIDIVEENKKLIELRDFLLPLLMNGQVSIQN